MSRHCFAVVRIDRPTERAAIAVTVRSIHMEEEDARSTADRLNDEAPNGVVYIVETSRLHGEGSPSAGKAEAPAILEISEEDLRPLPSDRLLRLEALVSRELARRGHGHPTPLVAERWALAVARQFFGASETSVASPHAGFDLVDPTGRRIEVKAVSQRLKHPMVRFRVPVAFDVAFVAVVDELGRVDRALILDAETVDRLARPSRDWLVLRLTPAALVDAGAKDITAEVRAIARQLVA
jgi:hypothetical protein